ncbi:MAG TPA: hypothetical protein VHU84_18900, partial [Lacipirellulaceae bacterium]|nr:hypothetical protein [Lacipirellulaceae bacterium]
MAGVLDKLEQVRALDPAAEPKLLEELHHTPPNTWPLVAEQYRATLAYHQQLMAKEQTPSQSGEYTSDALLGSPITGQPQSVGLAISTQPSSKADLGNERLSSRIGALGDPRGMGTESSRVLAQTTPDAAANVAGTGAGEKVPAKFVGDVAMQPLDRGKSAAADQAIYHAGADDMHPVSQALAKSEPGGPVNAASSPNKEISTAKVADTSEANDDWQRLVRKAADDLAKRVSASPSTTAEIHQHVSLRMLWLLSGDTEKALEPIPHI